MSMVIKFRVWDTIRNRWASVGDSCNGPFISMHGVYRPIAAGEFTPVIIEQFTGLLDQLGREVYEGDIVKLSNKDNQVSRDAKVIFYCYGWHFDMGDHGYTSFCDPSRYHISIIGNIHESVNPHI